MYLITPAPDETLTIRGEVERRRSDANASTVSRGPVVLVLKLQLRRWPSVPEVEPPRAALFIRVSSLLRCRQPKLEGKLRDRAK